MSHGTTFGAWLESDWYDDRKEIPCECGAVYPRHSRKVNASSVNGKANGCTACKPTRRERELLKSTDRVQRLLTCHLARKRTICRDVAIRYLERFGGQTFRWELAFEKSITILKNANSTVLGEVSDKEKYPK